ncbi:MAG: hypothetical protein U1E76_27005 [Planctomycetota bacterium]
MHVSFAAAALLALTAPAHDTAPHVAPPAVARCDWSSTWFWDSAWRFTPQYRPDFQIDAGGTRHFVSPGGYSSVCHDPVCGLYYLSSADGYRWNDPIFIPASESLGGSPAIACFGARTYIAWSGAGGVSLTWTEDAGRTFAEPSIGAPGAPLSDRPSMEVDRSGILHLAWGAYDDGDIFYLRTTPGLRPQFFPVRRISVAKDEVPDRSNVSLGVDDEGFVSVAWISVVRDSYPIVTRLRYERFHRDDVFGPASTPVTAQVVRGSVLETDRPHQVQVAVAPEGPIAVVYMKSCEWYGEPRLFTMVSSDGASFEGPFEQAPPLIHRASMLSGRRCIRAGRDGRVYGIWFQRWKAKGRGSVLPTYVESWDGGRTFPRREIMDEDVFNPPNIGNDVILALSPDEARCYADEMFDYGQCDG